MVSEEKAEEEASSTPRLQLFTVPTTMESPTRSGTVTPPLHSSAAVPFRWEEEPGKPRPCTALIALPTTTKCLELPPRLQLLESSSSKMTRTPSPTTVLDGPYPPLLLQSSSASSSFRFKRDRKQGSFAYCSSPERGQLGAMVLAAGERKSKKPPEERKGKKRLFGSSWGRKSTRRLDEQSGRREGGGGSLVFSYSMDIADFGPDEVGRSASARMVMMMKKKKKKKKTTSRITSKTRTHLSHSHSQPTTSSSRIWAAIYEGFKQVLPWSKKSKKEGS